MRAHRALGIAVLVAALGGLAPAELRAESATTDQAIARASWLLRRNPRDAVAYHRLGDAYIRKWRETGDVGSLERAEDALRRALAIAPELGGASRRLAYALYLRHEFTEAMPHAERAIALDPGDADAYGILGDARLEIGDYAQAEDAYRRMLELRADLASLSRRAGLESLRGDPAAAIADLERAIAEGRTGRRPPESIAWAQWQLGAEHWALGNVEAAEAAHLAALETFPGYYRAAAGLAQVRVAQARDADAIELYLRALRTVPLPEHAAALGDLYTKLGRHDEARKQYDLVEYIGRLDRINQALYNRELAYFYADHDVNPAAALALAEREQQARRDIYADDLLAWALYRNGRARDAVEPMRRALRLGTRDAKLFFHAGMIHRDLGELDTARDYLRRALTTNPHFHVLLAPLAARTLRAIEAATASAATP